MEERGTSGIRGTRGWVKQETRDKVLVQITLANSFQTSSQHQRSLMPMMVQNCFILPLGFFIIQDIKTVLLILSVSGSSYKFVTTSWYVYSSECKASFNLSEPVLF